MAFAKTAMIGAFALGLNLAVPQAQAQSTTMSPACDVPEAEIAGISSLGTLSRKLKAGESIRILAIGSSSTYGLGASSRTKTYPSDLRDILTSALKDVNVEIINRGISGEVASMTAERIRSEVALQPPDLVLWQLGTNDALSRIPPDEFEQTVVRTIEWLRENNVDLALIGLQYTAPLAKDEHYKIIRDVLKRVTQKYDVLYIHRYAAMEFIARTRKNLTMLSSDNFHLNDLGYECMAQHVAHAIVASLFAKRFRPMGAQ